MHPLDSFVPVTKKEMSAFNSRIGLILRVFLALITCSCSYELFANKNRSKFIYMEGEKCILYINRRYASVLSQYEHEVLPAIRFKSIFQKCFEEEYRNSLLNQAFIFPGTHWCGIGTMAKNLEDFGAFKDVDACCRQHDLCPLFIRTSRCDYNMCNYWFHTISHCDCDQTFHDCLKQINSTGADIVGTLYFDLLHTSCFYEKQDSPKCPLIKIGKGKCETNLKRLKYIPRNYMPELPVIRRIKNNFLWYLNKFLLNKKNV